MDGVTSDPTVGGYDWSYVGAFFRATTLTARLLAEEFSGRYDGSPVKFPQNSKWASSPRLRWAGGSPKRSSRGRSEGWLDNFKIRSSPVRWANGNIDPYKYTDYMTLKSSTVSSAMRWEPTPSCSAVTAPARSRGDLDHVRRRRRSGPLQEPPRRWGFDRYRRYTTDMYTVGSISLAVYGTAALKGNNALVEDQWLGASGRRDSFRTGRQGVRYGVKVGCLGSYAGDQHINPTGNLDDYYEADVRAGAKFVVTASRAFP